MRVIAAGMVVLVGVASLWAGEELSPGPIEIVGVAVSPDGRVRSGGSAGHGISVEPDKGMVAARHQKHPTRALPKGARADDPVTATLAKAWNGSSWTVTLGWAGQGAPVSVSSSADPSFQVDVETLAVDDPGDARDVSIVGQSPRFFDVHDPSSGTVSQAVEGIGYDPIPRPQATGLGSNGLWWGDSVTVQGQYFDSIAKGNLAFLYDLPVRASSVAVSGSYATSATFGIPLDGRGGPVYVQSHGKSSTPEAAPELKLVPTSKLTGPVIPFSNIRNIVYAPQTGNIWVAADNIIQEIDIFNTELVGGVMMGVPVLGRAITGVNVVRPYISRVVDSATSSINGCFLYVEGGSGHPTIYKVNVDTGAQDVYAQTTDSGFTRQINPVGITPRLDGTSCFIADSAANVFVKVFNSNSSLIVNDYGLHTWSFTDPAVIATAPNGYLLAVPADADKWLWYVTPTSSFAWSDIAESTVRSILIDHDITSSFPIRFYYSENVGMAEVFNRKDVGGNGPKYHGGFVWDEPGGHVRLTFNPFYKVLDHLPQRVILSNADPSFPYSSENQVADRIVKVKVHGWDNVPVKLRVIDPPDLAPYAPDGGWSRAAVLPYEGNDNTGTAPKLSLNANGSNPQSELVVSPDQPDDPSCFAADCGGASATVYLVVPEGASGDNYQVEVTKCKNDGTVLTQKIPGLSAVYTSWKRIFVERDKMFRRGGALASNYGAVGSCGNPGQPQCCGQGIELPCNQVAVYRGHNVTADNWIMVFDESSVHDWGGELVRVTGVGDQNADGVSVLTIDRPLQHSYLASNAESNQGHLYPLFQNGHSGGVGVIYDCDLDPNQVNGTTSCLYEGDLRTTERAFAASFVEVVSTRNGASVVPYLDEDWFNWSIFHEEPRPMSYLSWIWNYHAAGESTNWRHLVGASTALLDTGHGWSSPFYRWLFIFRGAHEVNGTEQDPPKSSSEVHHFTQSVSSHELGHHFALQSCSGNHHTDSENPEEAWCETTGDCGAGASHPELCLMNTGDILADPDNNQLWDPFNTFCTECLLIGDTDCPSPDPGQPRPGAIRTHEDPLP